MKAAVFREYGPADVIKVEERPIPVPTDNQILVRVKATAVTAADYRIRGANFPAGLAFFARLYMGYFKPRESIQILGTCFSGVVESVGKNVRQFTKGNAVVGMKALPNTGTYAEFLVIDEDAAVTLKPKSVSHQEAAGMVFGGSTALYFLRDLGRIKKGETILINGASGSVGTNAVQLAKYYGATVTAVCSTKNIKLVKSLGADKVVDYTKEDVSKAGTFDVVFTAAPSLSSDDLISLSKSNARILLVITDLSGMLKAQFPFLRKKSTKPVQFINGTAPERKEDLNFLLKLMESKKLKTVIDKEYSLDEIVEAHRYADTGHKAGNVIITVDSLFMSNTKE